jgi:hypothetical protein
MDIQVYAEKVNIESSNDQVNVFLNNVDSELLLGEFTIRDLLEYIASKDYASMADYVSNEGRD